jgi:hypothetical protein
MHLKWGAQLFGRSLQKSAGALLFGARAYTGPALLLGGGFSGRWTSQQFNEAYDGTVLKVTVRPPSGRCARRCPKPRIQW